ncbi:hypothetical protein Tco_0749057 [Tanacetum coccineum]|uniref:Uncharacterized protein n=1 Tax=Tanacetum coccineum TaxID=301880 RepID=A0ABQ4YZW6_9ASTR
MMIHGPCGDVNMSATCMQREEFSKEVYTKKKFRRRRSYALSKERHRGIYSETSGIDRIFARVSRPLGESSNAVGPSRPPIEEIQNYIEGRFVCPHEVLWRILKFDIHCREPALQILSIHLEGHAGEFTFMDRDFD